MHDEHDAFGSERRSLVPHFVAGAGEEAAAVNPDHHRQPLGAAFAGVQIERLRQSSDSSVLRQTMSGNGLVWMQRWPNASPDARRSRGRWLRRGPPEAADRRRGVGNPEEHPDAGAANQSCRRQRRAGANFVSGAHGQPPQDTDKNDGCEDRASH